MKKNLRIVSAAAAALLAVAPVAASAVNTVSADAFTNIDVSNSSAVKGDVTVNTNLKAVTAAGTTEINNNTGVVSLKDWDGTVTGTVTATVNGKSYTGNLTDVKAKVYYVKVVNGKKLPANDPANYKEADRNSKGNYVLKPGAQYFVLVPNVSFNFGTENANKDKLTIVPATGIKFLDGNHAELSSGLNFVPAVTAATNQNGGMATSDGKVASLTLLAPFEATNTTNTRSVQFFEKSTGNVVTSGNVSLNANSNSVLNVNAVEAAINAKYGAHQYEYGNQIANATVTTSVKDIKDQLAKQGMNVDPEGNFTANKSFNITLDAKSGDNAYTNSMVVTVSVPNGKDTTPATVAQVGTVKIMHAAYTYELKDGKLTRVTSADTLHAYNVIPYYGTTTVNGKKYYRVSGEHEWYINAGNVDGTSRVLNHNSYVYNNKGKRVKSEGIWKKGSKHTTYGAAMNIKGNRMYRVNKNRYVKVVNFDKN